MPEDTKQEQAELEKLLNEPSDDGEDEGGEGKENGEEEGKDKGGEDEEGKENKGEGESTKIEPTPPEGEEEDKGKGKEGEDEDEDEFKGKSREEVIKALKEERKKAADLKTKKSKVKKGDEGAEDEDEGKEPVVPTPEELQKMTPSDFAKWVLARIDEGVKRTIESQSKVTGAVKKEIAEAKKEHNLKDPDYRKMVLAIIEAGSAKGTVMPLKDACKQVDAFLGKHAGKPDEKITDEEKSRLKKAKAQVESGAGAPTKPDGSDAETKRIQKALGGSGQKSPLGGLGV